MRCERPVPPSRSQVSLMPLLLLQPPGCCVYWTPYSLGHTQHSVSLSGGLWSAALRIWCPLVSSWDPVSIPLPPSGAPEAHHLLPWLQLLPSKTPAWAGSRCLVTLLAMLVGTPPQFPPTPPPHPTPASVPSFSHHSETPMKTC